MQNWLNCMLGFQRSADCHLELIWPQMLSAKLSDILLTSRHTNTHRQRFCFFWQWKKNDSLAFLMCVLPKSSCKLEAPTVEALSWEPSRGILPFLASRETLALRTVTWEGVLDGCVFHREVEGWEAWLRASWRLLEKKRGSEKWWTSVYSFWYTTTQEEEDETRCFNDGGSSA